MIAVTIIHLKFSFLDIIEECQKLLYLLYHLPRARVQRHPLVQGFRLYLQNPFLPVRGQSPGLFGDKRHRVALVQQSQFPGRV